MNRESDKCHLTLWNLGGDASGLGFFARGIGIGSQDDKMNRGFLSTKLDNLIETAPDRLVTTDDGGFEIDPECDHTIAPGIGDPEGVDSGVIAGMTKHVRILVRVESTEMIARACRKMSKSNDTTG